MKKILFLVAFFIDYATWCCHTRRALLLLSRQYDLSWFRLKKNFYKFFHRKYIF